MGKTSFLVWTLLGLSLAAPPDLTKRTVSGDGACGGVDKKTCQGSKYGNCCSQYNWCGSSSDHCGTGCQSGFGTCSGSSIASSSSVVRSSPSASSIVVKPAVSASPSATAKVTTDGSCGGSNGYICAGSVYGNCCSQWGWCGSSVDHCGSGCNAKFGKCTASQQSSAPLPAVSSSAPQPSVKVSTDGTCGQPTGFTCTNSSFGNCCSEYGWCGSSNSHCQSGCNPAFGTCSGGSDLVSSSSSPNRSSSTWSKVPTSASASPSKKSTSTSATSSSAPSSTAKTLTECLGSRQVPVKMITDSDWNEYVVTYNIRLQYTPATVVLPTTAQHVSDAVICAGLFKIKVQAKSGGHSYASFSTGGQNGIMMIDLEQLQNVTVDSSGLAVVGAGLRLGNLATKLYQSGRAMSHGTCPGVGIGGHATHGGYGYSSRTWGLALDAIVGLDVVLANGTYIKATSTNYPDVFWAMRGAADSFGIVVNFYLQTQPAPASVINFSFSIPSVYDDVEDSVKYFLHIQDFAMNATVMNKDIGFGIYMDGEGFSIGGQYFGQLDDFNTRVAPELLRTLPTPSSTNVQPLNWIDALTALGGENTLTTPVHGYALRDNFFAKSVTIPEANPLTAAGLSSFFEYIQSGSAPVSWFSIANVYGGPGSVINSKDDTFSAYKDRDSLWVFQNYGYVATTESFPAAGLSWINGLNAALTSNQANTGAYLNYVDPTLTRQQAYDQYYGTAIYNRLRTLKGQLDPANLFKNPQSI